MRRPVLCVAVGLSALLTGCGGGSSSAGGSTNAIVASSECAASSSSSSNSGASSALSGNCTFIASDGRRFKCSSGRYAVNPKNPTVIQLGRARGCVGLSRLHFSPETRALIAEVSRTRSCLQGRRVRVLGGPILASGLLGRGALGAATPEGELIASFANRGAFIVFYRNATTATASESSVAARASPAHGRVERFGSVLVIWLHAPSALGNAVRACVRA